MRDRAWLRWMAAGLLLYTSFMIVLLPASWIGWAAVKANIPATLFHPVGTVWRGSARATLHTPGHTRIASGEISWRINPLYLAIGRLGFDLEFLSDQIRISTNGKIGRSALDINKVQARLPVSTISLFYPLLANASLTGTVLLDSTALSMTNNSIVGAARINLESVSSSWLGRGNQGSYNINLDANGKVLHYSLTTSSGAIQIQGAGSWELFSTGKLDFDGRITAENGASPPSVLQHIGKTNPDGTRQVQWSTRAPFLPVSP